MFVKKSQQVAQSPPASRSPDVTHTAITDGNGVNTLTDVPVGQYTLQVNLPGQGNTDPPSVQVTVPGTGGVAVPAVPARVQKALYLPSVYR